MMFKRISIGISVAVALSGCTLLEDGNYIMRDESVVSQEPPIESALSEISSDQQVKENSKRIEQLSLEWSDMVKNINRVVELDSELSYLMTQLKKTEGLNSLTSSNLALEEYSSQTPKNDTNTNNYSLSESMDRLSNQMQSLPTQTKTQVMPVAKKAMPILTDEGVDNTKFSGLAGPSEQVSAVVNTDNDMDSKFSSLVGPKSAPAMDKDKFSQLPNSGDQCANRAQGVNGSVGIHLISVKNQRNLSSAADSLKDKFPNELCETSVKIENVSVNGEAYYSLRFGPYANREYALSICSKLKTQGQYCGIAEFSGRTL